MVSIVVQSWYPPKMANEAGRVFLENMKRNAQSPIEDPPVKVVVPSLQAITKEGIHAIGIFECVPGREAEALLLLSKTMLTYANIEGYTYTMNLYVNPQEAYSTIDVDYNTEMGM